MQRSENQSDLFAMSVSCIILAAVGLSGALLIIGRGAYAGAIDFQEAVRGGAEASVIAWNRETASAVIGTCAIASAALDLLMGALGMRAAKDGAKCTPACVAAAFALALNVTGAIVCIAGKAVAGEGATIVCSLVFSAGMLYIANGVKRERTSARAAGTE